MATRALPAKRMPLICEDRKPAAPKLGISARTVDRHWVYARAWLHRETEATGPNEKIKKIAGAGDAVSSH
jgi:ECF sigma factor